ncbi:hypothetical protein Angca_005492, partial [Angiostrongylus cantonensis]
FYAVSHLNHVLLPDGLRCSGKHGHCNRFKLDDQLKHKLGFIRENLPRAQKVYLLGYSIGEYMMLRLPPYMKDDFYVKKAIGLFPTVEKIAESPNGVRFKHVLGARFHLCSNRLHIFVLPFDLDCLPPKVKKWLISWNLSGD